LGYQEAGSTWNHPAGRKVIFLGDYVDRGPAIRRVLEIVRGMVTSGDALAIMGNHEHNAIHYHLPDDQGDFLRPHIEKNIRQHAVTMAQFSDHREERANPIAWFAQLPLWLDLGGLRAVHATWDAKLINSRPEWQRPGLEWITASADRESEAFAFAETVLKGLELLLPVGYIFTDKEGARWRKIRARWWMNFSEKTYHELCLPTSDAVPHLTVPETKAALGRGHAEDAPPVFFGHYWLNHERSPQPLAPNLACLKAWPNSTINLLAAVVGSDEPGPAHSRRPLG